jgi:hypothetical protein
VMAGIAEALVATGIGLLVAMPAVVAYNIFQKRVTDVEDNVSAVTKQLRALLLAVNTVPAEVPVAVKAPSNFEASVIDSELAS